jgi:hypothetical protein
MNLEETLGKSAAKLYDHAFDDGFEVAMQTLSFLPDSASVKDAKELLSKAFEKFKEDRQQS